MGITYGDWLIDSGYYDITPEQERVLDEQADQERELEAIAECERRGIDPHELCADGGIEAWMIVAQETRNKNISERLCSDCPRVGHPTDKTRCLPCPQRQPTPPAPAKRFDDGQQMESG